MCPERGPSFRQVVSGGLFPESHPGTGNAMPEKHTPKAGALSPWSYVMGQHRTAGRAKRVMDSSVALLTNRVRATSDRSVQGQ